MISVQSLIVCLIVSGAAAYIAATVWRQIGRSTRERKDCGDQCGCGK